MNVITELTVNPMVAASLIPRCQEFIDNIVEWLIRFEENVEEGQWGNPGREKMY